MAMLVGNSGWDAKKEKEKKKGKCPWNNYPSWKKIKITFQCLAISKLLPFSIRSQNSNIVIWDSSTLPLIPIRTNISNTIKKPQMQVNNSSREQRRVPELIMTFAYGGDHHIFVLIQSLMALGN